MSLLADRPRSLSFEQGVDSLVNRYARLWHAAADDPPTLGDPVPGRRRWINHRRTKRLIKSLAARADNWTDDENERQRLRGEIKAEVQRYGEETLGWPESYRDLVFGDDFYRTTVAFSKQARAFDPRIVPDDLGQALRNVWIMNSVQMLLDLPVAISPSIFAYSMLYPYTDNYLDDPGIPVASKRAFNDRLGDRLRGAKLSGRSIDPKLRDIFRLFAFIEDEHPRNAHPQVYASLAAIHEAQVGSLRQQRGDLRPGSDELLRLSIRKGGTSVLADAYLVAPGLDPQESDFCFGYGVFLQFLDDLQDVESDREAGHATLFSVAAGGRPLDRLTSRLLAFMRSVLATSERFSSARYASRKDLILRNCTFLLMGAISEHHRYFSRDFLATLEARWPLGFASMRKLRRFASRQRTKTMRKLRRRGMAGSLLEFLA